MKDIRDQRRPRPQDIDRHIGARMREWRIMLGLAQQQLAELIGVTYQQRGLAVDVLNDDLGDSDCCGKDQC